jgi:hypothetical protein
MRNVTYTVVRIAIGTVCFFNLWAPTRARPPDYNVGWDAPIQVRYMHAQSLEQSVREALPIGSPLAMVEGYLNEQGLEFSFYSPARIIFAITRNVQGSGVLISKAVTFRFHFDDELRLESIEVEILRTGP